MASEVPPGLGPSAPAFHFRALTARIPGRGTHPARGQQPKPLTRHREPVDHRRVRVGLSAPSQLPNQERRATNLGPSWTPAFSVTPIGAEQPSSCLCIGLWVVGSPLQELHWGGAVRVVSAPRRHSPLIRSQHPNAFSPGKECADLSGPSYRAWSWRELS